MPIHDWTHVDAGLFHAFHRGWIVALANALNSGMLPRDCYALISPNAHGTLAGVTDHTPRNEVDTYARKADWLTVRARLDQVVAVVEIVSPGNKASRNALREFAQMSADLIRQGIHLLVIDLFPPGPNDPQGIHKAIWDEFVEDTFTLPPDKPLTLVSYEAGPTKAAYLEPVAVGEALPDMPLFLTPECYIPAPLERTYQATWDVFPAPLKGLLEPPGT